MEVPMLAEFISPPVTPCALQWAKVSTGRGSPPTSATVSQRLNQNIDKLMHKLTRDCCQLPTKNVAPSSSSPLTSWAPSLPPSLWGTSPL